MEIITLINQIQTINLAIEEALQQTPRIAIQDLSVQIEYQGVGDGSPTTGEIVIRQAHDITTGLASLIEIGNRLGVEFVPPRGHSLLPSDTLGWLQLLVDDAAAIFQLARDNPHKILHFSLTGMYSQIVVEVPCTSPVPFYFIKNAPAFGILALESPAGVQFAFSLEDNLQSVLTYIKRTFRDLLEFAKVLPSKKGQPAKSPEKSVKNSKKGMDLPSQQPASHLVMLIKSRPFHFTQLYLPFWATFLLIGGTFAAVYGLLTLFEAPILLGSISGIFAVLMVMGLFIDNRKLRIVLYCLIPGFIGASSPALVALDTRFLISHALHFVFVIYYLRCWYLERELIAWTEIFAVMVAITAYFGILYYLAFDNVFGPNGWGYPYLMPQFGYLLGGTFMAALGINAVFNWIKLDRYPAITLASQPQSSPATWKAIWTARPPSTP